jgi:alpha-beta hydrolase superfamily lysophospholipase
VSRKNNFYLADMLLNVTNIRRAAAMLAPEITLCEIEKATHDIFLSKQPVREQAFQVMFHWLNNLERDWILTTTTTT